MSDQSENSHAGHRKRLRERFITQGSLDSFQPHNSLELLLFYSIPRADTNDLAHKLIDTFGSFKGVFDAPYESLKQVDGVGENTAVLIKLIPSLFREYLKDGASNQKYINSTEDALDFLRPEFVCLETERFFMICLDKTGKILNKSIISKGSTGYAEIDTRSLISTAINCQASSVVLAHNHPGGICAPSREDNTATLTIVKALNAINVNVLDHLIISEKEFFSFAGHPKFKKCLTFQEAACEQTSEDTMKSEENI
ncbi:MAG: DNA repair protein RadC [Clostridiales bacterium]|nr:DNA repair protein RadC [Clostridiales bacterium]